MRGFCMMNADETDISNTNRSKKSMKVVYIFKEINLELNCASFGFFMKKLWAL